MIRNADYPRFLVGEPLDPFTDSCAFCESHSMPIRPARSSATACSARPTRCKCLPNAVRHGDSSTTSTRSAKHWRLLMWPLFVLSVVHVQVHGREVSTENGRPRRLRRVCLSLLKQAVLLICLIVSPPSRCMIMRFYEVGGSLALSWPCRHHRRSPIIPRGLR
jgi:hypothetical protein